MRTEKLRNMKVTVIPTVSGALGTVTKELEQELEDLEIKGQVETSQQHFWDWPEYWEESWRLVETCSHSDSSKKLSANAGVKNLK